MWLDELTQVFMTNGYMYKNLDTYIPRDTLIKNTINFSTIENAKSILHFVKEMAEIDSHPPFHYILFYICRSIFGDSPPSLRILSILPSILSILLIYIIGKNLYGKIEGIGASIIMALSTPQIIYAHEVRHYSFLVFLGLLTLLVYLFIIKNGPNWKLNGILAFLIFLMAFTHFFSIGFILGLGVYSLISFRGKMLKALISSFIVSAFMFLIAWGYPFYLQFFCGSKKALEALNYRLSPQSTANFLPSFIDTLPERYFLHLPFDYTIERPSYFVFVCLLPCVAILWRRDLLLPWILFILTSFFVVGLDLFRGTFHSINIRYTLLAAPALYLIVSAGIFTGPRKLLLNSLGTIAIILILFYNLPTAFKEYRDNWHELSQIITKNGTPDSPVVFVDVDGVDDIHWPNFMWYTLCYYTYSKERSVAVITKPLSKKNADEIGSNNYVWLITKMPEFPQSLKPEWPSYWIQNSSIENAWLLPNRATIYKLKLNNFNN